MSGKLNGRVTIRAAGLVLKTNAGATLDKGGIVRTPRPGDNDADGFTESIMNSTIECNVQMREGTSLATLQAISDGTFTFECDTGQVYMINHGYNGPAPALAGDGSAKCTFHGPPAEEML